VWRNVCALAALSVFVWIHSAYSQTDPNGDLRQRAVREYQSGRYAQAETLFRARLEAVKDDEAERARTIADLGSVFLEEERLQEAEQAFLSALAIYRKRADKAGTTLLLRHLGAAYSLQRRDDEAISVLREALTMARKQPQALAKITAEILNSLGVAHVRRQDHKKAQKYFEEGTALLSTEPGPHGAEMTSLLNNLGVVHYVRRNFDRAEQTLLQALKLTTEEVGPSHPALTYTLSALGGLYREMKRYQDAEEQFQRALAILRQGGNDFDMRVSRTLQGLGETYIKAGKTAEAEAALHQASIIARRHVHTHPDMPAVLEAYSRFLKTVGKVQDAQQVQAEAQAGRAKRSLTIRAYQLSKP